MTTNTKVFWTSQEREILGEEIDRLVNVVGGYTSHSALSKAQEKLPPDRRRQIAFWAQVRDRLTPELQKAKLKREQLSGQAGFTSSEESEERSQESAAPLASGQEDLAQLIAKALVPVIVKTLEDPRVASALSQLILRASATVTTESTDAQPTYHNQNFLKLPGSTKPKVLIAGLLPAQAEEVKKDFSKLLDLKFWRSDESKDQLRALSKNCQVSVGMTNFMGHPADALLKDLSPRYIRHSGGIKTLKAALQELI